MALMEQEVDILCVQETKVGTNTIRLYENYIAIFSSDGDGPKKPFYRKPVKKTIRKFAYLLRAENKQRIQKPQPISKAKGGRVHYSIWAKIIRQPKKRTSKATIKRPELIWWEPSHME